MRFLVVASYAPSLINFRGALLRQLVHSGHSVVAVAPFSSPLECDEYSRLIPGVQFLSISLSRGGLNPFSDLCSIANLFILTFKADADTVFAYTLKPVLYMGFVIGFLRFLRFSRRPKYIAMITGVGFIFTSGSKGFLRKCLRKFIGLLYLMAVKSVNHLIFQNPDDLNLFSSLRLLPLGVQSHRVYGSGVDLARYAPQPLPKAPIFLVLSRLIGDKGIREYVEAARQVKKQFPSAVFRLAGMIDSVPDSISEIELQSWIDEQIIQYLGDLRDVRSALADCRFYVLPSYREGTPRSVLEALSTARPVITTDAPGCRETVSHGFNGLLVPPGDSIALAEAMIHLISQSEDETMQMANASLQIARERYDIQKVNAHMLEIMEA